VNSEKQLMSLIHAAQVLTSTLELDKVLHQLIKEVLNVIDGAHAVILFLHDSKRKKLVIKKSIGFDSKYLQKIELNPDEGMTGKTFTTRKAQIFSHIDDTSKGMQNIQPANQQNFHKALGSTHHFPVSTICAPLMSKEGCLGVLTIDSFSEEMVFDQHDLLLLETFANQAAIALENAKLFSQQERSKRIHSELAQASVSQKGLDKVAVTLGELLNKRVCLFNEFMDYITASADEASESGKKAVQEKTVLFKRTIEQNEVIFEHIEEESIYLFPIKTDKAAAIGVLAIFGDKEDSLDSLDLLAVDLASNIFAMEMMGQERMLSDLYKYEGYLLEQLLNHKLDSFSVHQRLSLGISESSRYVCIHIKMANQLLPFQELNSKKQYFNRLLYRELQKLEYKVLVLDRNMEYDILVVVHDQKEEEKVLSILTEFFSALYSTLAEGISLLFYVGLGRMFDELNEIDSSYRDAVRCAEYIQLHGFGETVFAYNELGIYRLFLKHDRDELKDFVSDLLGPLITYDEKHDTELVQTLNTYLECQQNMTQTAHKSFVHLNTIKYRLQKIREILETDKLEGKELFELQLAIYLHEFLKLNE
jgi:sugar diacid utilization regulator